MRVSNIGQLDLNETNLVFIDEATHKDLAASEVLPGDLLIVKASVGEKICRFPNRFNRGNITQHIIGIRPNGQADMDYVAVVLFSAIGRRQLERRSLGSVIQYLGVSDARSVLIPNVSSMAQRYVGDKVRQAERLRRQARMQIATARVLIDAFVQGLIGETELNGLVHRAAPWTEVGKLAKALTSYPKLSSLDAHRETKHTNRIASRELTSLWTAQSYRPEITQALAQVRKLAWKPLGELCSKPIAQGRSPEYAKPEAGGYPCLKTRHVNGLFVDDSEPDLVTQDCAREMSAFKVERETILMNRSGAGSVGRCAVYLLDGAPLTNEHLLHIRVAEPHDACFVTLVLSSWWGERAIEQGITGSTGQLNLSGDHVARVPIPMVEPDVQRGVGNLLREAATAARAARALTSAATQLVERLIEGTVTEAELIAAQQALDGGDTGPEHALLKALYADDSPDAPPLFPDLDALYALLGQDQAALEEAA